ncbi:hypothetical protein Ae263Ps1_4952c [Pseudonocardia sp. Ae263_Ps1]|nr:hypothetical protein Ae150APs1_0391 [Pseudonocardia sp. Ae150A_Ps1]OLL87897.1 hypothetical protein Ae263Ps1_4952c [Pseudonocardia sp. Ae263_Ps1]OLL92078.1 hypothetical protein Ae356Ps1_1975 [Pseudonocardia sp. Ae356_Ps1]
MRSAPAAARRGTGRPLPRPGRPRARTLTPGGGLLRPLLS